MSKATIDNQSNFPATPTRRTVRWVLRELGVDLPSLVVRVLTSDHVTHHGRFYPHARSWYPKVWARTNGAPIPKRVDHLIVAHASPKTSGKEHDRGFRGGPPPIDPQDWIESLLCITAHEAMHFRQWLYRKPGDPRWSEVQAEWAEYRLLRRWRERNL